MEQTLLVRLFTKLQGISLAVPVFHNTLQCESLAWVDDKKWRGWRVGCVGHIRIRAGTRGPLPSPQLAGTGRVYQESTRSNP